MKTNLFKRKIVKLLVVMFCVVTMMINHSIPVLAKEVPFSTSAHAYVVMDAHSGEILYSYNTNKKIYPASTVKLMTAIVALESNATNKNFVIKRSVLNQVAGSAYKLPMKSGSKYSFNCLLNMMLISSDANATYNIAANSAGNIQSFIKKMNKKAKDMGLKSTSFDNPIGLDIGNGFTHTYSTAKDMATIARHAMGIEQIRTIVSKKTFNVPQLGRSINNTNRFYRNSYNTQLFTVIGCKTGTTNAAGSVLIATAIDKKGHEVICAYFGEISHQDTFNKINKIFSLVFNQNNRGKLNLSKGYLDMRFKKEEKLVTKYLNSGKLKQSKDQQFHPQMTVSEKEFLSFVKSVSKVELKGKHSKKITFKDFEKMFFKTYPLDTSSNLSVATGAAINFNDKAHKSYLYDIGIFTKDYPYTPNKYITRLDMVLLSDHINKAVQKK